MNWTWVRALRAGVAFLTRIPTGGSTASDWDTFARTPAAFPVVGVCIGVLAALPLLAIDRAPAPTVVLGYLLAIYLVTGINHLDGVADLGDAAVVHGDRGRRREVLKDTTTGVGAILAVCLVVAGLALAGLALTALPIGLAVTVAITAEIGAKLGMATVAGLGTASHDGFGSQFTQNATPRSLGSPFVFSILAVGAITVAVDAALPAIDKPLAIGTIQFVGISQFVGIGTICGALAGTAIPWLWARRNLGGASGDVFGAANEVGRVVGLHAGVIAWTLW